MPNPKRLIEVDLYIKRISEAASKEKGGGHISSLHIWWARRPLAACRAVICSSLWPDPADESCPSEFISVVKNQMMKWSTSEYLGHLSKQSIKHFIKSNKDLSKIDDLIFLRKALLEFITDFSNAENANNKFFLDTARELTEIASKTLNKSEVVNPIVVDPFAGGGSIPLEANRINCQSFASDLNPIPFLINKTQLEYIPRYGLNLKTDLIKIGEIIQSNVIEKIKRFYQSTESNKEIYSYIWARTIKCEGPSCGFEIPITRSLWLDTSNAIKYGIVLIPDRLNKIFKIDVVKDPTAKQIKEGTSRRSSVTCPNCGFTTSRKNVEIQSQEVGFGNCLLAIALETVNGREYRIPDEKDYFLLKSLEEYYEINKFDALVPDEELPYLRSIFNVKIYGFNTWGSLFSKRQLVYLLTLVEEINSYDFSKITEDENYIKALKTLLAFALDKSAIINCNIARWRSDKGRLEGAFALMAIPMVWDWGELNPFCKTSTSFLDTLTNIAKVIDNLSKVNMGIGNSERISATDIPMVDDSVDLVFTDPPYYDSIPYANLSDFFFVWLKKVLHKEFVNLFAASEAPKENEIVQLAERNVLYQHKTKSFFEDEMAKALTEARRITKPNGIACIVFAHKTTDGWESLLNAVLRSGWVITASWPIDTEMTTRFKAIGTASLSSSIHLVCRPRENEDGSLIQNQIGDWRDVQQELPKRINEWMPRLADEGVAGADAIFACLGPALEIFSRYSSVEKPNGDVVTLREYLEKVWAAVSQEALNMVFTGGEAQGLEEDARLTAMWLWTLTAGSSENGASYEEDESDDEANSTSVKLTGGFTLEYDTARKIAQGLGANLEDLKTLVEVKGDKARLLPVIERTSKLFGSAGIQQLPVRKKKKEVQLTLSFENAEPETESKYEIPELKIEQTGKTVLDRLHQAMLLFSIGRTEALKRFLVEDGAGKDDRFWKLAQSLTSLYPKNTDERRWVEAVQTYKKSLGF